MKQNINWLAAVASAVAGSALGFIWYGMLFLKQWAAGNGITINEATRTQTKNGMEHGSSMAPMAANFVSMLIFAYLINWLINRTGMTGLGKGSCIGGIIGIISMVSIFVGNMFALNPTSLSMVDGVYSLILFTLIGAIMGAWRK